MSNYLRIIGFVEATSLLLLLFIAMPLKYAGGMPEAVRIVGSIHGLLFLTYGALAAVVANELHWSFGRFAFACLAASIPFGPFIFDKKLFPQLHLQRQREAMISTSGDSSQGVK